MLIIQTALERYVIAGGVMMIFLIPCLVLMIAFVIQSFLNLRPGRIAPKGFARLLHTARQNGGTEVVRQRLQSFDHSLAEIIRNVYEHLEFKPDADAAEVLRDEIESECDALLEQNSQLGVIYRITPLLGLLGTVFGMIQTFGDFTSSQNPDIQQLSAGINVALITTAWGLSIAIPAYIALYLLQRRISTYEQVILPREAAAALHAIIDRPISGSSARIVTPPREEY